ncbi:MAG TPA: hypothetical protein VK483_04725 [Chitinophagaceae bacterium]|nr:hypothetical protein [Chitinophagaceae bacterium]
MLKKLIIIATLVAGMAACKSNSKAARDYNNDIITQENILVPEVTTTETNVKRYYEEAQYDSIAAAGERMEGMVQKSIDAINAIPVPKAKGVADFKAAMVRYFTFIKSMYTNYKEYGQAGSDEKREEVLQKIKNTVSQRQDYLNEMQGAQRKFAAANNFKLERQPN